MVDVGWCWGWCWMLGVRMGLEWPDPICLMWFWINEKHWSICRSFSEGNPDWVFQMLSLQNLGDVYPSWYVALINMETAHPFTDGMFPPVILCRWYMFIHTYTHIFTYSMRFSKEDTQSPWLIIIFLIRRTICGFRAFLDTPISYHMGCHTAGLCGGPPSKGSQSSCGCSAGFDQRWT